MNAQIKTHNENVYFRLLLFVVVWLGVSVAVFGALLIVFPDVLTGPPGYFAELIKGDFSFMLAMQLSMLAAAVVAIIVHARFVEECKDNFVPIRLSVSRFVTGMGLALIMGALSALILLLLGAIQFRYEAFSRAIAEYALLFLVSAYFEELLVRGYVYRLLSRESNAYLAVVISSLFFAALHGFNSSLSFVGFTNLFLLGVILAIVYRMSDYDLSMPFGLHFMWNFFIGPVLGFNVSGFSVPSIFTITTVEKGLAGGDFGCEGSLVVTSLFVVSILALLVVENRKSDFK